MNEDDKIEFVTSTIGPMARLTHVYLSSVFGVTDPTRGKFVGSGFRCIVGGKPRIVTALHVAREAASEPQGAACSAGSGRAPVMLPTEPSASDPATDVAFFDTPVNYPNGSVPFWPADAIDSDPTPRGRDYLFVHGFPQERSKFVALLGGHVARSLPYGVMERDDDLPHLEPWEFAMDFDPKHMRLETGDGSFAPPDAHGLSGSPVWRIGAYKQRADQWNPSMAKLVGVVTKWNTDRRLLIATSIERVLRLATT